AVPRRAVREMRRRGPGSRATGQRRRTRAGERDLAAAIRRDLPPATIDHGPLVSVVILNRDGRALLERCLAALDRTSYQNIELIVVDNGSTDGSVGFLDGLDPRFPLRVIRNEENRSYSDAND